MNRAKSTKLPRGHQLSYDADPYNFSSGEQDGGFRGESVLHSPPLPAYEAVISKPKPENLWQQRIFVGDLQRFNMMEVGGSTSAQDIVDGLGHQGELEGNSWMLFELAQDFGMDVYTCHSFSSRTLLNSEYEQNVPSGLLNATVEGNR